MNNQERINALRKEISDTEKSLERKKRDLQRLISEDSFHLQNEIFNRLPKPQINFIPGIDKRLYFVPRTYEKTQSWNEKVMFAMYILRDAFIDDIVSFLLTEDKELSKDGILERVTVTASRLKQVNVLDAKKVGNRNLFIFKNPEIK